MKYTWDYMAYLYVQTNSAREFQNFLGNQEWEIRKMMQSRIHENAGLSNQLALMEPQFVHQTDSSTFDRYRQET